MVPNCEEHKQRTTVNINFYDTCLKNTFIRDFPFWQISLEVFDSFSPNAIRCASTLKDGCLPHRYLDSLVKRAQSKFVKEAATQGHVRADFPGSVIDYPGVWFLGWTEVRSDLIGVFLESTVQARCVSRQDEVINGVGRVFLSLIIFGFRVILVRVLHVIDFLCCFFIVTCRHGHIPPLCCLLDLCTIPRHLTGIAAYPEARPCKVCVPLQLINFLLASDKTGKGTHLLTSVLSSSVPSPSPANCPHTCNCYTITFL